MGLVGPNGAGKTTTLHCLAGITDPDPGADRAWRGTTWPRTRSAAKSALAFVPDEPHLFEYLTVEEHLRFVARLYRVADVETRIPPLLAELELADRRGALPEELSRGMKQKLAIACGLIARSRGRCCWTSRSPDWTRSGIRRMKATILRRAAVRRGGDPQLAPAPPGRGDLHPGADHAAGPGRWPSARCREIVAARPELAGRSWRTCSSAWSARTAAGDGMIGAFALPRRALRAEPADAPAPPASPAPLRGRPAARHRLPLGGRRLAAAHLAGRRRQRTRDAVELARGDRAWRSSSRWTWIFGGGPSGAGLLAGRGDLLFRAPVTRSPADPLQAAPRPARHAVQRPAVDVAAVRERLRRVRMATCACSLGAAHDARRCTGSALVRARSSLVASTDGRRLRGRIVSLTVAGAGRHGGAVDRASTLGHSSSRPGAQGIEPFLDRARERRPRPGAERAPALPFRLMVAPAHGRHGWPRGSGRSGRRSRFCSRTTSWVIRSDAAFEEAAVAAALRRPTARTRVRVGRPRRSRAPADSIGSSPAGWPGRRACLWKNLALVVAQRAVRARGVVLALAASARSGTAGLRFGTTAGWKSCGWFAATLGRRSPVRAGPQWVRNDLRADLPELASAAQLSAAGDGPSSPRRSAASTLVLTALQLGLVARRVPRLLGNGTMTADRCPSCGPPSSLGALLLLPAINLLAMLIQNGAAVLFPAWVHLGSRTLRAASRRWGTTCW